MPGTRSTRSLLAVTTTLLIGVLAVSACSKKKDKATPTPSSLPAGSTLLADSANAMRDVQSVHFKLTANGAIEGLTLHSAEGDLKRNGDAKGSATIDEGGAIISLEFVIVGPTIYIKGPTGGFQGIPLSLASSVYDPSAILDPDRGITKVLTSASSPEALALEKVNGADAYKVKFNPDIAALSTLVPGATIGSTATVWVDATTKRCVKGEFVWPAAGSNAGGTVTIEFSDFDKPVDISAP
jgi:lipoprotein LprG